MKARAIDRIDTILSFRSLWILRAPQQARAAQSDQWLAASSRDSWNGVHNPLDLAAVAHFFGGLDVELPPRGPGWVMLDALLLLIVFPQQ